jgi:hypothetical protein
MSRVLMGFVDGFIPSTKPSSSASFFRDSVCQRSEARVTLRKPKNSRRISRCENLQGWF